MRVFVSGLRKLIRRPATLITLGVMLGLLLVVFLAVGATADQLRADPNSAEALLFITFPLAYLVVLGFVLQLGGLLALIYGAAVAGSEWTWGTLKNAVARGEGRSWYVLMTYASIVALILVGFAIAYAVGVGAAVVGANLARMPTDGINDAATLGDLPELLGRGWLVLCEQAAIGFAVATLARSQLAGIGVGIAASVAEPIGGIFASDVTQWLPFSAGGAAIPSGSIGGGGGGQIIRTLDADTALIVVAVWLVAAIVVAVLATERAEISG